MVKHFLQETALLAAKALANGGERETLMTTVWDISGNCQGPYQREIFARPNVKLVSGPRSGWIKSDPMNKSGIPLRVMLSTRCRSCINCRKARATLWRNRMLAETATAPRTWFLTMTFMPEVHDYALNSARFRGDASGADYDDLGDAAQFAKLVSELGGHVTRYWKRLRKAGAQFRYCIVAEPHKSGKPHFHALVHEVDPGLPVRHALLREQWGVGFIHVKLVNDKAQVGYLCKYLVKSASARVRASVRYGEGQNVLTNIEPVKVREISTPFSFNEGKAKRRNREKGTDHANRIVSGSIPFGEFIEASRLSTEASTTVDVSTSNVSERPEGYTLSETFG